MGKPRKFAIRAIITVIIMVICVSCFCALLRKEILEYTNGARVNFYKLPEDSIDVIFLGSSHSMEAFIPQELYNEYGITSYNLSCSAQPPLISYYWLKEAMKTQKFKTVVLDVYFVPLTRTSKMSNDVLEFRIRTAIENMRWGEVRIEAIHEACKRYENLFELSYYLPNIRYHDRWKDLYKADFIAEELAVNNNFMGYPALRRGGNKERFLSLKTKESKVSKVESLDEYIEKIVQLCKGNNIKLILVKTPFTGWTLSEHNTLETFANENDLPFYDMNVDTVYNKMNFNYNKDIADNTAHANLRGAIKLTSFIGKILRDEYGLLPHKSKPWEDGKKGYANAKADYKLQEEKNLNKYLSLLKENKERYTIFIAAKDEASKHLSKNSQKALSELGLITVWNDAYRKSYYAVIEGGNVLLDEMSAEELYHTGSFNRGRHIYNIESAGKEVVNNCSIKINGGEKAKGKRGLNIVVFNNERQMIIDSVCFDTYDAANKISRLSRYELMASGNGFQW